MKTSPREQAWLDLPCRGGEGRTAIQPLPAAPQQVTACRRGYLKETRPVDSCGKIRESSFATVFYPPRVFGGTGILVGGSVPYPPLGRWKARAAASPAAHGRCLPHRSAALPLCLSSRRPCGRATAKGLRRSGRGEAGASAGRSSGWLGSSPARALPAGPCPAVPWSHRPAGRGERRCCSGEAALSQAASGRPPGARAAVPVWAAGPGAGSEREKRPLLGSLRTSRAVGQVPE